jgi:hypothetical protein
MDNRTMADTCYIDMPCCDDRDDVIDESFDPEEDSPWDCDLQYTLFNAGGDDA